MSLLSSALRPMRNVTLSRNLRRGFLRGSGSLPKQRWQVDAFVQVAPSRCKQVVREVFVGLAVLTWREGGGRGWSVVGGDHRAGRTYPPAGQLLELAHDTPHAPADVLPREPKDQVTHRLGQPRPADLPRLTAATLLPLPPAVGQR